MAPDGRSPRWSYRMDPWAWRLCVPATTEERQDRREVSVDSLGCWGSRPDPGVLMQHSGPTGLAQEAPRGKRLARALAATWVLPITD